MWNENGYRNNVTKLALLTTARVGLEKPTMNPVLKCLSRFLAGEPVTGRNYGILVKLAEEYLEDLVTSFFWDKIKMNFECFPSLSAKSYISRKINLHRNLVFSFCKIPSRRTKVIKISYSMLIPFFEKRTFG